MFDKKNVMITELVSVKSFPTLHRSPHVAD
jgi:hypothetical protein